MAPRTTAAGRWLVALGLAIALGTFRPFASQQQAPTQPTFRTATNLVVIDAVVVDGRGHHVRDLTSADFEVVQGGRRMEVRQAVYVDALADAPAAARPRTDSPAPVISIRPDSAASPRRRSISDALPPEGSRIMAIVVDDLGLSFESTAATRRALTLFIDEQVGPGDLVAILKTSAGAGALQQFTTDKRQLREAIERVRWTILSRSGISAFTPIVAPDALGASSSAGSGTAEATDEDTIEGLRTSMLAAGSLGALEFVIRGVEPLPGRKSVVFVSEGMRLISPESSRVWHAFTRVMDRANRAGVVVYTLDPRGLVSGLLSAEDNPQAQPRRPGRPGADTGSISQDAQDAVLGSAEGRRRFLLDSQQALTYIAEQTGGFAVLNTNDLGAGLRRVLDDASGYYLIGYEGEPDAVRAWDPGRVSVRVTRPGLRVRARKGLFGPADAGRPRDALDGDPLVMAAMSPFGAGELDVRATALFGHAVGRGSFLRSLFFIDPGRVEFTEHPDGRYGAQLTLLLLTLDERGEIATEWRRLVDLQLEPDTYRRARAQGILYSARIPIKAPGAYQLRVAAKDERTSAIGSSSQFLEVPKVGKGHLAVSSIVMQGADVASGRVGIPSMTEVPETLGDTVFGEPWVRIFRPGTDAIYTYEIYDGISDAKSTLTAVAALLRDGRTVQEGPASAVGRAPRTETVRVVPVAGRLSFSEATPPGVYALRITVSHARSGKVTRQDQQWASFEVR